MASVTGVLMWGGEGVWTGVHRGRGQGDSEGRGRVMCLQIKELTRQVPAAPGSEAEGGQAQTPHPQPTPGAEPAPPEVTGRVLGASLQSASLGRVPLLCLQDDALCVCPAKPWVVTDDLNRPQWPQ